MVLNFLLIAVVAWYVCVNVANNREKKVYAARVR